MAKFLIFSCVVVFTLGVAVAFNCYQCEYSKLPNTINGDENCVGQMDRIENSTIGCKNSSQCQYVEIIHDNLVYVDRNCADDCTPTDNYTLVNFGTGKVECCTGDLCNNQMTSGFEHMFPSFHILTLCLLTCLFI